MSMRNLIVSADDIGLSKTNTDSILETVDKGAVTSVSILANGLAFSYAVEKVRERTGLRVAIHLNLTEGKALTPHEEIPLLTTIAGDFKLSSAGLWSQYLFAPKKARDAFRVQVKKELRAQISVVRTALGYAHEQRIPVDGHQHVHMVPFVFDVLISLVDECALQCVRIPNEPLYIARVPFTRVGLMHVVGLFGIHALAKSARRKATRAGMHTNDAFVGLLYSGYVSKEVAEAGLAACVVHHPKETEILFHPGVAGESELNVWKGNTAWHTDTARGVEHSYVMSEDAVTLFNAFKNGTLSAGPDLFKILRYLISGGTAAFFHLGTLFLIIEYTHLWYVYANMFAFGVGLSISFFLQKFWTFTGHAPGRVHHQVFQYTAMQLTSLGITTGGLYLLVEYLHMWYLLAEFLLVLGVAVGNFFISNTLIFKKHGIS